MFVCASLLNPRSEGNRSEAKKGRDRVMAGGIIVASDGPVADYGGGLTLSVSS
jgi:hypothetical protein